MSRITPPATTMRTEYFNVEDAAFTRSFDRESARRQLRVSLAMVAAMAGAAFVLGFVVPMAKAHEAKIRPAIHQSGAFAGRLVAINEK